MDVPAVLTSIWPLQRILSSGAPTTLAAVFEQAYGAILVIVAGSIIVGRAICVRCGRAERWSAAPLVGLAALIVLADASIKLPGRAHTSVAVCALAVFLSAGYLLWRGRLDRSSWHGRLARPAGDLLIGAVALFAASIPFIGQNRVGPGALVDNDMGNHLIWAEALRSAHYSQVYSYLTREGYPLGPHALVAVVWTAIGAQLIQVFAGLLVSVMVLTAIVAGDVLRREALWRRTVIGILSGTTYLVAAYYGEGSFKETIMAGLVLAFALHLEQLRERWSPASHATRFTMVVPAGVLVAGAIYTYSYLAIAWFGATLAAWGVVEIAVRPALARGCWRDGTSSWSSPGLSRFVALLLVVLAPIASELRQVLQRLRTLAGRHAGVHHRDSRQPLRTAVRLRGARDLVQRRFPAGSDQSVRRRGTRRVRARRFWCSGSSGRCRRRELPLLAGALGCALIWLYADRTQSPYVTAKALVIGAPIVDCDRFARAAHLTAGRTCRHRRAARGRRDLRAARPRARATRRCATSRSSPRRQSPSSRPSTGSPGTRGPVPGDRQLGGLGAARRARSLDLIARHGMAVSGLELRAEQAVQRCIRSTSTRSSRPTSITSITSSRRTPTSPASRRPTSTLSRAAVCTSCGSGPGRRRSVREHRGVGPARRHPRLQHPGRLRKLSQEPGVAALMTQPVVVGGLPGLGPGKSGVSAYRSACRHQVGDLGPVHRLDADHLLSRGPALLDARVHGPATARTSTSAR